MFLPAQKNRSRYQYILNFFHLESFHVTRVMPLHRGHVGWMNYFILQILQLKKKRGKIFLQYKKPASTTFFILNLVQASTFRIRYQCVLIHRAFLVSDFQFPTCPFRDTYLLISLVDVYWMHFTCWAKMVKTNLAPAFTELKVSSPWIPLFFNDTLKGYFILFLFYFIFCLKYHLLCLPKTILF